MGNTIEFEARLAEAQQKLAEDDQFWPEYRDRPAVVYDCPVEMLADWNDGVPPQDGKEYTDVFVVGLGRMWLVK